mgnify:CR=1 FL=1
MKSPKEQLKEAKRAARKREPTEAEKQIKEEKRKARSERKKARRRRFCEMLRERGLPCPEPEHRFHDTRKWRIDYAWEEEKVALEVEGGVWTRGRHTRGSGFLKDVEKYNEVALHGFVLIRTVPDDLLTEDTLDLVERAITLQSN